MPQRRALGGAFEGASDVFDRMIAQRSADRVAVRNDQLERARKADELIASGKLEQKDRAAFIAGQYAGPDVQERLSTILSDVRTNPNQTSKTLANRLESQNIPSRSFGEMPGAYQMGVPDYSKPETSASMIDPNASPSGPQRKPLTLSAPGPSGERGARPLGPVQSPAMTMVQEQKRANIPTTVMGKKENAEGAAVDVYGQRDPDTGLLRPVQESIMGPTNAQKYESSYSTAAGSEAGGQQTRYDYRKLAHDVAYSTSSGSEQARLDALDAGFQFITQKTTTGAEYINLDQYEGRDKQLAARIAAKNGLAAVQGDDAHLLVDIDQARLELQRLAELGARLPMKSRATLAGLQGATQAKINAALQADPLAAEFASTALGAIGLARTVSGQRGFRANRVEYEGALSVINPFSSGVLPDSQEFYLSKIESIVKSMYENELARTTVNRVGLVQKSRQAQQPPAAPPPRQPTIGPGR